jgi:inner membrane protein
MDPITHALSGLVFSKTLTKNKTLVGIFLVYTLLPDIDFLLRLHSVELLLKYHRSITHGFFALFLLPLFAAFIFKKKVGFLKAYSFAFLGYGLHLFLDLTNQYGIRILSPLDWSSYDLSITFIVDPYVIFPLLLALILSVKFKKEARIFFVISIVFIGVYMGFKAYLKAEAREFLKQKIEAHQYRVYPLPNDFLRWWFVVRFHDDYTTGYVDLFGKRVYVDSKYKIKNDDVIQKTMEFELVKVFLNFAKHPVADTRKEGDTVVVIWRELSYRFLPDERFTVKVWLKESHGGYKILNSKLKI